MDNSDETTPPPITTTTKRGLNFKATELRLGLPGLDSPERDTNDDRPPQQHQQLLSIDLNNGFLSGPKRDFIPGKWGLPESSGVSRSGLEGGSAQVVNDKKDQPISPASNERAQVVGWPPIRSFRKNTMASHSPKAEDEAEVKLGTKCLYVKVSMDGAPYLRKVDLRTYGGYSELSIALESMFSCFTIGQYCGSHGGPNRDGLSESGLMDLLHGSEYVLTYKDKDGDWMLVGDIPWKMFTETCRRLRIMKSSEAIGLAPRAMEKQLQQ